MSITKATLRAALVAATLMPAGGSAADLAADVAAKLRGSGALQGYRVAVKAKSGTVWLEGRVADEQQLAAAVGIAEASPGVERVVNRLTVESATPAAASGFGLPASMRGFAAAPAKPALPPARQSGRDAVQLAQAVAANPSARSSSTPGPTSLLPSFMAAKPAAPRPPRGVQPAAFNRNAMRGGPMAGGDMALPGPQGMGGVGDGQIVPGSVRYHEGSPGDGGAAYGGDYAGAPGGYGDGGMVGGPMPMGGGGVGGGGGMPPIPMRGDGPNMPNYAWPSYAAYPNYAALQYPTQYSPTAWPYIGPFYPYPQVPLGWRRVSLEWDDGWWWLDFDERHIHSHHR